MARGWESKSVEQQQEEMADKRKRARDLISGPISEEQQQRNRKREGLLLSRERLNQQLKHSTNPRHREMLQQALAELDAQLSSIKEVIRGTEPK
jgi:hypothetical protein